MTRDAAPAVTTLTAPRALARALGILGPVRDVLEGRVDDDAPPAWCARRGWDGFLLGLDDDALRRCEEETLAALDPGTPGAPADLTALARDVAEAIRLPALAAGGALGVEERRSVSARKQAQLPALLGAVGPMAREASRIVDVGAGSGHFTVLAAEAFARQVLGIDRDPGRVAAATARAEGRAAATARFVALDACRDPLALAPGDLAVGLHACGELGDRLVLAAAEAGCDLALVSCCLQKIPGPSRAPLSRAAATAGFTLRRETLGLANLSAGAEGVETTLPRTLAAREARYALQRLLRARGLAVPPGEEMRGQNRRRAHGGLAAIAAPALARLGQPPATAAEIQHHEDEAHHAHARMRRLSLPRNLLARLLEVAVVLDRATALAEAGHHVRVATLCDRAATPRNLAILASREEGRLPPRG